MTLCLEGLELPLRLRAAATLSDSELERFSEENRPYRIERNKDGELLIMTPVGSIGGLYESEVSFQLGLWARQSGSGVVFSPSTGFTLSDGSVLSPDACWISKARWDALRMEDRRGYARICPEFVIEMRSESDVRRVLEQKMTNWLANGSTLGWLIDPAGKTVTIYRCGEEAETLERPEVVKGSGPVAGFELQMERFWSGE